MASFAEMGWLRASAVTVDIDGDARDEVLVQARGSYSCEDFTCGGSQERWHLVDAKGREWWADEPRGTSFDGAGRPLDRTADVDAVALAADGIHALRVRADGREWYLRASGGRPVPTCLW